MMLLRLCASILIPLALAASAQEKRLSTTADYEKYIAPLLSVKDFGMHYYDDGAADASVIYPSSASNVYERPLDPISSLIRLGKKSHPLLIDCLSDERLTAVWFAGNTTTREMRVPLGYVCLDLLMHVTESKIVFEADCANDGLGACVNTGYYFRPDDYFHCAVGWEKCVARPWIAVVQKNWARLHKQRRLQFHNPYDSEGSPDYYKEFATPRK